MNDFAGARVLGLESRHATEMASLIEKRGGIAISAPSMREVPLEDQTEAFDFAAHLLAGACDVLVLLTGVGFSTLLEAMCLRHDRREIVAALSRLPIACRGPKPVRVLKTVGLTAAVIAPEPNTSKDLLEVMAKGLQLAGKHVFVQEYGRSNPELAAGLETLGATVTPVPVYAWQLPENTQPLQAAVEQVVGGNVDVALFTSARQIDHLLEVARRIGQDHALVRALDSRVVIASVGPVTSEALTAAGIAVDTEPPHPKMGQLVTHTADVWRDLAAKKRT